MKPRTLLACAAAIAVAACASPNHDPVDHDFGEAHRWNIAQQVVDPDPVYEEKELEGGSGERAAGAIERYRTGDVIEPASIETTDTAAGGPN